MLKILFLIHDLGQGGAEKGIRKAMMERVAFAEHSERETYGGSFLWKTKVKTAPELQGGK